jgi:hypothetical protein
MSDSVPFWLAHYDGPKELEVEQAREIMEQYKAAINVTKANALMKCVANVSGGKGCGGIFSIKDAAYIQTHWYENDLWHKGEGKVECPLCSHRIRLHNSPELVTLKKFFKLCCEDYEK